jgi:hypothetical protein
MEMYSNLVELFLAVDANLCKNQAKCIKRLIDLFDDRADSDMTPIKRKLGNRVFNLAKLLEPEIIKENYRVIRFLQLVFATLSINYMAGLSEVPDLELLEIMKKLVAYQSKECELVCYFWESYLKRVSMHGSKERLLESLQGIIKDLLVICLERMILPEDLFMDLNVFDCDKDLFIEIKDQRKFHRRIVKQIGACMEASNYWPLFKSKFTECIQALNTNSTDKLHWIQLEAILVILSALLKGNIPINHRIIIHRHYVLTRVIRTYTQHDQRCYSNTKECNEDYNGDIKILIQST